MAEDDAEALAALEKESKEFDKVNMCCLFSIS